MTRVEELTTLGREFRDIGAELEALGALLHRDIGLPLLTAIEHAGAALSQHQIDHAIRVLTLYAESIRVLLGCLPDRETASQIAELVQLLDRRN